MINLNSQEYIGMKRLLIAIAAIMIVECSITVAVMCNKNKNENITEHVIKNGTDIWTTN